MINIKIENFEGPLDLLLHLVESKQMDIKEIVISSIIDEYLEIINTYEKNNFNLKIEFLQMASLLIEIKANAILKVEEVSKKQVDLENRLMEYKLIKEFANYFSSQENEYYRSYSKKNGEDHNIEIIEHDYSGLNKESIEECLNNLFKKLALENKYVMKIDVEEEYSVEEAESEIMRLEYGVKSNFSSLLKGKFTRSRIVAYFMAILNMYKNNIIHIVIEEDDFYIVKGENV